MTSSNLHLITIVRSVLNWMLGGDLDERLRTDLEARHSDLPGSFLWSWDESVARGSAVRGRLLCKHIFCETTKCASQRRQRSWADHQLDGSPTLFVVSAYPTIWSRG